MMEEPNYQALTCAEFAHIVRDSGVLEVPVIPDYMNKAIEAAVEDERQSKKDL